MEKGLPELVTEDSRGHEAVRYNMLPLMTLQAMKEQQDQIKTLQAENSDLKARLERLEQMMMRNTAQLAAATEPVQ